MPYAVTHNSEIIARFNNLRECKDLLFRKHCFEEVPRKDMKVFDSQCNVIPMWNDEFHGVW